ncbi:Alpha-tubulin N-acetyltransferase 1 [Perkinsus chesapeaki]|uniref:Alpha-tubulin N-acetyltransferase 1 n=1 Tax=Perkinsus chesapeaki TaxID=330153 RepID=A0A7J6MKN9_PERCH|nr:Alpha-tubulin N-acetyltransferase 1 [Perkinsus chesapeaki]
MQTDFDCYETLGIAWSNRLHEIVVVDPAKVGCKRLFVAHEDSPLIEILPLCVREATIERELDTQVLDFYVHESCQRCGVGLALFQAMLDREGVHPASIGNSIGEPSPKLLSFLSKHYRLDKYSPQANKFVIFSEYFKKERKLYLKQEVRACVDAFSKPSQSDFAKKRVDAPTYQSTHNELLNFEPTTMALKKGDGSENEEELNTQDALSSVAQVIADVPSLGRAALSGCERQHQLEMIALQRSLNESQKKLDSMKAESQQNSAQVTTYTLRRPF